MNYKRIKNGLEHRANRFINERRGWKTDRKIVVIESDDWGSIRMPNRQVYEATLAKGIPADKCHYCKYDTLATADDFSAMYDVLRQHKDKNGNNPMITANTIVANPDFEKIKQDDFQNYHYELFTETLDKYLNTSFELWKQGIEEQLFFPQLHGREHLNVERWLKALQDNSIEAHFAFEHGFFGISTTISQENNPSFMAALDFDSEEGKRFGNQAINEACHIFENIFGYRSKSFIGPNYFWHDETEDALANNDVPYLQGGYVQKLPNQIKHHYLGQRNQHKQIYLIRNVQFEPAGIETGDLVAQTLAQIDKAFKLGKPAIISTHRVTFIGAIFEENRTKNLRMLNELLGKIIKKWPDVEFMNSVQLGDLVSGTEK